MALGDVVDQLLDQHGLADAGAAEQADLAALGVRREQVDDLDAGDEDRGFGRLVDEGRGLGVDRGRHVAADRAALVDRLADDVHDAAERLGADGHADLRAGGVDASGRGSGRRSSPWRWCGRRSRRGAGRLRGPGGCRHCRSRAPTRIGGSSPSNATSTTAPMTWLTRPVRLLVWLGGVRRRRRGGLLGAAFLRGLVVGGGGHVCLPCLRSLR